MSREFARSGIRFEYPDNWTLETEDSGDGWTATVSSPDTAFMMLSFNPETDDPAELADLALSALKESYPDLEAESAVETLAGQPAIGYDVDFFTLDLTNTCWIRALAGPDGCVLLMCQCT